MGFLGKNSTIGLFFGQGSICRAVKVVGGRKEFEVVGEAECLLEGDNLSEKVRDLVESLRPSDDTLVIAGSDRLGTSVDLVMPKLSADDLHHALEFEVPKYTPLSDEDIIWGYRVIGDMGEKGQHIRLGVVSADQWEHFISLVSSVSKGIEMILPPVMALDPAFGDVDFCTFDDGNNRNMLCKSSDGLREAVFVEVDPLESSFKIPRNIDIADNCSVDDDEISYKAVLMAVYGLTANIRKDRRSWIKVPQTIKSKRPLSLMFINVLLLVGIMGMAIFTGVKHLSVYNKKVAVYKKHIERLKKENSKINVVKADDELISALEQEMDDVLRNRPGFTNLLTVITETVDDSHWCDSFSWDGERFSIKLKTNNENSDVAMALEQSGYFENVTFKKNQSSSGLIEITVDMQVKESHRAKVADEKGKEGGK